MTKQQRKEIYWAAMFEIEAFGLNHGGVCLAIMNAYNFGIDEKYFTDMNVNLPTDYPELHATRPKKWHSKYFWFPPGSDYANRLECLSRAIYLCDK